MRLFFYLVPFLLLATGAAGCGSKVPADSNPPPGVFKNPISPDPEAIKRRKGMLIDPQKKVAPSQIEGKR